MGKVYPEAEVLAYDIGWGNADGRGARRKEKGANANSGGDQEESRMRTSNVRVRKFYI